MVADGAMPMASIVVVAADAADAADAPLAGAHRGQEKLVAISGAGRGIVTRHDGQAVPAGPADPQKKQYETMPVVPFLPTTRS